MTMEGYENNYKTLIHKLADCDFNEAAARLGLNQPINDSVTLSFLNRDYFIRKDGVFALDGEPSNPNCRSILIHYITSKGDGEPENKFFLPHYFLPNNLEHGIFSGQSWLPSRIIREIGDDYEKIHKAMEILGAKHEGEPRNGEHIWQYLILPKIPIQIIYYEADDEFPCEIKIKLDGCAGRYIEFETIAFLCGCFVQAVLKACV